MLLKALGDLVWREIRGGRLSPTSPAEPVVLIGPKDETRPKDLTRNPQSTKHSPLAFEDSPPSVGHTWDLGSSLSRRRSASAAHFLEPPQGVRTVA